MIVTLAFVDILNTIVYRELLCIVFEWLCFGSGNFVVCCFVLVLEVSSLSSMTGSLT